MRCSVGVEKDFLYFRGVDLCVFLKEKGDYVFCYNKEMEFKKILMFYLEMVFEVYFDDKKGGEIKSLGLPRGAVIGSLVRGDDVIIPDGETNVEGGDHLIVFTLPENVEQVCSLFSRQRDVSLDGS